MGDCSSRLPGDQIAAPTFSEDRAGLSLTGTLGKSLLDPTRPHHLLEMSILLNSLGYGLPFSK